MIDGNTRLICLLGSPVAHSMSPAMQNAAFEAEGLNYAYLAFDIREAEIGEAVSALKRLNFRGCNLTMPLKRAVIPYLDSLSEVAELCGSVNTIVNDGGKLTGYSTDGTGLTESLRKGGAVINGATITMLGAGGAATSIAAQLAADGAERLFILQRKSATFERATAFSKKVNEMTDCRSSVIDISDEAAFQKAVADSSILINATNVGMGEDKKSLVPKAFLRKDMTVCDIIYEPLETTLLKEAGEAGALTVNGSDMLLYQGAAAFELWTGKKMPVDMIRRTVFLKEG